MTYFHILALALMMVTQVDFAQARKPAVDDFVGIEVDHPEDAPQGTEGLFNFEKDIHKFQNKQVPVTNTKSTYQTATQNPNTLLMVTIALIFSLPAIIWILMMYNLRQKAHAESASNIEVLEKYRKDREEARKAQEDYRKVS
jgi:hypothetical protein